eukprot:CAMPEP_0181370336 /NCGR_PEP_ID=MMETSP1106-20121128/13362_1 /TAXON_ID=81844 /ORGANISM="Mantoniella antarctica, Strain SL-175" /LENGTH=112 /DNA_ID=CAMNT_0023487103 /DNA_START=404 /DNA_END=743 /DNA_ORIENTATION=-
MIRAAATTGLAPPPLAPPPPPRCDGAAHPTGASPTPGWAPRDARQRGGCRPPFCRGAHTRGARSGRRLEVRRQRLAAAWALHPLLLLIPSWVRPLPCAASRLSGFWRPVRIL